MTRRSAVLVAALAVVAVGAGCSDGSRGGDLAAPPSLSLAGASGVVASLRRTVTEVDSSGERVVSVLDTTLWAPFDDDGAAIPEATEVGVPGPVGWTSAAAFNPAGWSGTRAFVDSTGLLHELTVVANDGASGATIEYRKGGWLALRHRAKWKAVDGGVVLDSAVMTFMPADAPVIRVDVGALQVNVAHAAPLPDALRRAGTAVAGLLRPQPLEAQVFYFSACSSEWLAWGGTALLAEVAWMRAVRTKRPRDFKLATAATATAGIALGKLVDCMASQPEQPTTNE